MSVLFLYLLLLVSGTGERQEIKPEGEVLSSTELAAFQENYSVVVDRELFPLLEAAVAALPEELADAYGQHSRQQDQYSLQLLGLIRRVAKLPELEHFLETSSDPMISFSRLFASTRDGDVSAAKSLLKLRQNQGLPLDVRRAIITNLALYGVDDDMTDPTALTQFLRPQEMVNWLGKDAPDFELTGTRGESVRLSDLHGKFVVLHFWATWCEPCVEDMPEFKKAMEKNSSEDLVVVCISGDFNKEEFTRYVREHSPPGIQVLGEAGVGSQIVKKFHNRMFPSTYILSPDGKIVSRNWRDLEKVRSEWLETKSVPK